MKKPRYPDDRLDEIERRVGVLEERVRVQSGAPRSHVQPWHCQACRIYFPIGVGSMACARLDCPLRGRG